MTQDRQENFITFMLECEVMRFGDFTTKSGRQTPYFINTGHYDDGGRIRRLGEFYAHTIIEAFGQDFDILYGPAYKGIPLAVTTAAALDRLYDFPVPFTFNRKQPKDHGEGGVLVGRPPRDGDRIVIIDDVVTAGTSVNESLAILTEAADVEVLGVVVSVDRQERGKGDQSALAELRQRGLQTAAIATLDDIMAFVRGRQASGSDLGDPDLLARMEAYRDKYGVAD